MSLDDIARNIEAARMGLSQARGKASGWNDSQREQFDKQRLEPLDRAAQQLLLDLAKAQDALRTAAKLQAD